MSRQPEPYPRLLAPRLREALKDSPAVLIQGPRQTGKTTLALDVGKARGFAYISFDDDGARDAAENDPKGFVAALPTRVILDEVQRVPWIFPALKRTIDHRRTAGRFILTGSTNVMLVPRLSESLAGRLAILQLHPLSQVELQRVRSRFIEALFNNRFRTRLSEGNRGSLTDLIASGGYPAALARRSTLRRQAWYRDLVETQIQRDVQDVARIHSLNVLPRLLSYAAANTASLFNASDLAAPFHQSRQTINDYVTVLERVFLVERLTPWHSNQLSRLVKTPKLHIGDTGLACALLGVDAQNLAEDRTRLGSLFESFVLQELRRQASGRAIPIRFFHYRDRDGFEVDIVAERSASTLAGIEVKGASSVRERDFRGLRKLRGVAGNRFAAGVVLYDGDTAIRFDTNLWALPVSTLWDLG